MLLKCHAFSYDDLSHPKMQNGFTGSLRPFRGHLIEENFHELMEILRVLAPELARPTLDREVMVVYGELLTWHGPGLLNPRACSAETISSRTSR